MEKNKLNRKSYLVNFLFKSNALVSNSFFIFIIRFFPSLANLLVMIWYSRNLTGTDYGHYVYFWIQLLVIYPIICFGIHVLVVTYSRGVVIKLWQAIKAKQYALYFLWAILLGAVFAVLQYNSLGITFVIPFLFILCYAFTFILESVLIVFKSYRGLTTISILYAAAFCAVHWCVLKQGFSLQLLFAYLLALTAVRFGIYCIMVMQRKKEYVPHEITEELPVNKIRLLWLHLGLYDILQVLFSYIDKFIISLVLAAPLSAIYYNGSQNIPFIPLLLSAAGSAVLMQLAGGKQQDEVKDTVRLMNQSGRVLSCIVFPLFFFLVFYRAELILALFHEAYRPAIPIFLVSIMVIPVRTYSFTTVLQRHHKGAIINAGAIVDLLLACGLMYPLYLWLGLPGVALSFVITTYLQAAFYLFYSAKLLHTSPLKLVPYANWLIKLIVFAFLFIIIRYASFQYFTGNIPLILGGITMVVVAIVSLFIELKAQVKDVSK